MIDTRISARFRSGVFEYIGITAVLTPRGVQKAYFLPAGSEGTSRSVVWGVQTVRTCIRT